MPRLPAPGLLLTMNASILIAYATKNGSTAEVAERVAARLCTHGLVTDVRAAHDVHTLEGYDGVILGSAIYVGRLHADARDFLHRYRTELAALPVAVFAMGPCTLVDRDVASSRAQLQAALEKVPTMRPISTAIFGGVLDPTQQHFPFNRFPASDARDWEAIDAWSDGVAARFEVMPPQLAEVFSKGQTMLPRPGARIFARSSEGRRRDALAVFPADEILIVGGDATAGHWLEHRARARRP
jgi:menaquinone-dependent protoporphyrinogen oxidase